MREIKLSKERVCLVNDEDYEFLNQFKWRCQKIGKTCYAVRLSDKIFMHRLIMGKLDIRMVDHKDRDGLNNQRDNLRFATKSQNAANSNFNKDKLSSKYRGVCWSKVAKKWESYIHFDNSKKYLGVFTNEEQAALEYNKKAVEIFGNFANLNKIA